MSTGRILWTPDDAGSAKPEPAAGAAPETPQEAAADPPDPSELEQALGKIEDLENKLKYLEADFSNFRRRKVKDLEDARANTLGQTIQQLLPVLDAIEAALQFKDQDPAKVAEGVSMIHHQLRLSLNNMNVEVLSPAPGSPLDPQCHEGVATEPAGEGKTPGAIVAVVGVGYRFQERVLRPARVVVVEEPPAAQANHFEEASPASEVPNPQTDPAAPPVNGEASPQS